MNTNERKHWIDCLRGFCMLAILLDHTEIYYTGTNIINYNMYVTDALYLFFFISGYLMHQGEKEFSLKKKASSVFRTLIMPYFIFTTVMALPKAVAHDSSIDLQDIAWNIITGQASWFVAALAIAELAFAVCIRLYRNNMMALAIVSIVSYAAAISAGNSRHGYVWQIDNALLAIPILSVGYAYHKYESLIKCSTAVTATSVSAFVITKIYIAYTDPALTIWHICISNNMAFIINVLVGCMAMASLFKKMPQCRPVEWIGRHSLVYYFLCGGIPLTVSRALCKIGIEYDGCYLYVLIAYTAVCALSTVTVACIYKYAPFTVGKKHTD